MAMTIIGPALVFIEPMPIIPVFSHEVATVEVIRGEMHFSFYLDQRGAVDGVVEHVINNRMIIPLAGVTSAMLRITAALREIPATHRVVQRMAH